MPHITLSLLLFSAFVSAQSHRLVPGFPTEAGYTGELVPRRLFDNFSECTASDTCSECFGLGYVLCDDAGCFNPDDGEQCCKGGGMCVGRDDSCCEDVCLLTLSKRFSRSVVLTEYIYRLLVGRAKTGLSQPPPPLPTTTMMMMTTQMPSSATQP